MTTRNSNSRRINKNLTIIEEVPKLEDYMEDLTKTFSLNIDMLENMIKSDTCLYNPKLKDKEDNAKHSEIIELVRKIKTHHDNKLALFKKSSYMRGKVLMSSQIEEELKKSVLELEKGYFDQEKELDDLSLKKENIIAQNEKKFNEVEIYIQRECMFEEDKKYHKYQNFTVVPFIRENQEYSYKKYLICKYLDEKCKEITTLNAENSQLKNEFNNTAIKENNINDNNKNVIKDKQRYNNITIVDSNPNLNTKEKLNNDKLNIKGIKDVKAGKDKEKDTTNNISKFFKEKTNLFKLNLLRHQKSKSVSVQLDKLTFNNKLAKENSNPMDLDIVKSKVKPRASRQERIKDYLDMKILYHTSLLEQKKCMLASLAEKERLIKENNDRLNILSKKFKTVTTKHSASKNINFNLFNNIHNSNKELDTKDINQKLNDKETEEHNQKESEKKNNNSQKNNSTTQDFTDAQQEKIAVSNEKEDQLINGINDEEAILQKISINQKRINQIDDNIMSIKEKPSLNYNKYDFFKVNNNLVKTESNSNFNNISMNESLILSTINRNDNNNNITMHLEESFVTKNNNLKNQNDNIDEKWDISVINTNFDL